MNTHHHIVISIGSNYAAETNIPAAMRLLRDSYPTIRFSKPIENAPIDFPYPSGLFTNLTAHFYSSENREEVGRKLKGIELQLGRTYTKPFDGRVAIDLDLIVWNNTILKNVDYSRPYIQSGLQELRINIQTQLNMTKESRSETFFHNKPNNWNCAQAVQKGFQDLTGMTDEAIEEEYRPKGGGRAEGGLCGALYSANRIHRWQP